MARTTLKKLEGLIDALAISVKNGFESIGSELKIMKDNMKLMNDDISSIKGDMGFMKQDISLLKRGQDDIYLRLDQHAYKLDIDDLKKRVTKIEQQRQN